MADTTMAQQNAIHGHIAARIDRLPLTWVQWQLALLVEITWGFIIFDTDGIGARLFPFVWRPNHIIDIYQYAVIQALQVGAGILLGVYLMSWVADRYGRRPAILLATLLGGFCIWPFAYVTNFWGMVVLSVLSTLGVGGIVATHSVYLSEMTSPEVRNKVLLTSQGVTALVAVSVNMLAFWLIPSHWQIFLWVSAIIEIVVLLPWLYWKLPESPRWLEAHGRHEDAERAMEEYERRVQLYNSAPLPEPRGADTPVVMAGRGAWKELFTNPQYRSRTWVLIVCWLAGYAGLIYGVGAFFPVYMVDHGGTAHEVFLTLAVAYACALRGVSGECAARRAGGAARCHRRHGDAVRGELDCRLAGAQSVRHRTLLHRQPHRHRAVPVQPVQLHGGGLSDAHPRHRRSPGPTVSGISGPGAA